MGKGNWEVGIEKKTGFRCRTAEDRIGSWKAERPPAHRGLRLRPGGKWEKGIGKLKCGMGSRSIADCWLINQLKLPEKLNLCP